MISKDEPAEIESDEDGVGDERVDGESSVSTNLTAAALQNLRFQFTGAGKKKGGSGTDTAAALPTREVAERETKVRASGEKTRAEVEAAKPPPVPRRPDVEAKQRWATTLHQVRGAVDVPAQWRRQAEKERRRRTWDINDQGKKCFDKLYNWESSLFCRFITPFVCGCCCIKSKLRYRLCGCCPYGCCQDDDDYDAVDQWLMRKNYYEELSKNLDLKFNKRPQPTKGKVTPRGGEGDEKWTLFNVEAKQILTMARLDEYWSYHNVNRRGLHGVHWLIYEMASIVSDNTLYLEYIDCHGVNIATMSVPNDMQKEYVNKFLLDALKRKLAAPKENEQEAEEQEAKEQADKKFIQDNKELFKYLRRKGGAGEQAEQMDAEQFDENEAETDYVALLKQAKLELQLTEDKKENIGSVFADKIADRLIAKTERLKSRWDAIFNAFNAIGDIKRSKPFIVRLTLWIALFFYLLLQPLSYPFNAMPQAQSIVFLFIINLFLLGLFTAGQSASNPFLRKNSQFPTVGGIEKDTILSLLTIWYDFRIHPTKYIPDGNDNVYTTRPDGTDGKGYTITEQQATRSLKSRNGQIN